MCIGKVMPSRGKEPVNKVLHDTVYKITCTILVHFVPERVIHPVTGARSVTSTIEGRRESCQKLKVLVFCT